MSDNTLGAIVVAIPDTDGLVVDSTVAGGPHITLCYIGDGILSKDDVDDLKDIVEEISASWSGSFKSVVQGDDFFGPDDDHHVVLLDPDPETSELCEIRGILIDFLTPRLKEEFDKTDRWPRFNPHMTLGQFSRGYEFDPDLVLPEFMTIKSLEIWNGYDRYSYPLDSDAVMHYGILRRSGRYPWGSGKDSEQRSRSFLGYIDELRDKGMSDTDIARGLGMSTTDLRATNAIAKNQKRRADEALAMRLSEKGMSNSAIGRRMGINESSVRALLDPSRQARADVLTSTSNLLKEQLKEKPYLDIGLGTEAHLGIADTKLKTAVAMLKDEDYKVYHVKVEQVGMPGKYTDVKVLAPPGTTYSELYKNRDKIQTVQGYSEDGGRNFVPIVPPKNVSASRIDVRYGSEGGAKMDGVIELRQGVPDISLQDKHYAQVRIAVDGTHYLKGMAIYADDLPKGVDIRFNTNKERTGDKLDALKPLKDEPENPFGSTIRQRYYKDESGKEHLSALNIVGSKEGAGEEGAWASWSRTLSSQVLSKQKPELAKQQLDLAFQSKKADFDEISSLTNPAVKRKLLDSFADSCDSASVNLKAAALPGQRNHVILPIPSMKDNEIYAPNYANGQKVVLIRHPHGGTFEIPELTVNNRQSVARRLLGNVVDAVGINENVAKRLSGADFDGDTVIVIPNDKRSIKTSAPLRGLKDFDPITAYPGYDGMKRLEGKAKQRAMGEVSNLITDMTIRNATQSEIARAVRHSMVVIDAEKHNLNYKQSEIDNGIQQLKKEYQIKDNGRSGGASTLISRSSSEIRVPDRVLRKYAEGGPIDPKTGEKVYTPTGEKYNKTRIKKNGEEVVTEVIRTTGSTRMAETKDAHSLSSGTAMETIYANHANKLKALANEARLASVHTKPVEYSPSAKAAYKSEVDSLNSKLTLAMRNKPLERQAQLLARMAVTAKQKANPNMEGSELKKIRNQELIRARIRVGAEKSRIAITPKEWAAIQAGAISNSKLTSILQHTDDAVVKQYAMPRTKTGIGAAKEARAKLMAARGYTQAEIAQQLGVSKGAVNEALN